jgi:protein-S-isoprenylcysteine O-methyltransferase Ste14
MSWDEFRATKAYDLLMATPLILWFGNAAMRLRPALVVEATQILSGAAPLFIWVQFFSLLAAAAFNLMLVWMLVVRDKPVLRSRGIAPRLFGFAGTFLGVAIIRLPVAHLDLPMQMLAAVLVGVGSAASAFVLWRLGKAFSILPEARVLVTGGPYAFARHPLYAVEFVTVIGTVLQFAQPWAALLGAAVLALLVARSHFEEQVLAEAWPEYAAYRAKTARFIPGII